MDSLRLLVPSGVLQYYTVLLHSLFGEAKPVEVAVCGSMCVLVNASLSREHEERVMTRCTFIYRFWGKVPSYDLRSGWASLLQGFPCSTCTNSLVSAQKREASRGAGSRVFLPTRLNAYRSARRELVSDMAHL